jgi:LacI family transcriptional regulator
MKKHKRTTIHDIAKKLNLNASSVSRALNGGKNVSEATRKLILDTAKELNYKHNKLAADLRKGENQTIGVVVPRINQNFFSNVIAGLEQVTYQKGYSLIICQSDESYEKEVNCIEMLINQHVSCIVISISADFKDYAHLQSVLDHGIKLIQFDRTTDEIDTHKVINDNFLAAKQAVEHLIEKGYQRIALLEGPQNLDIFKQRKAGYLAALEKNNYISEPDLMKANAWTKDLSAKATQELLTMDHPPDAIFASTSDFSALGVLESAAKIGISVPQQLGVCGYSNEAFTEISNPSITTLDQHSVTMGKTIAHLYFDELLNNEHTSKTVIIKPNLIIRNSTKKGL